MASSRPPSPTTAQGAEAFGSTNNDAASVRRESELGRKCFICQCWESEDDPPHQEWVNPCQCSLAAHQECILEWVDSLRRDNKPLKCPVCAGRIDLVVPFDPAFWLSQRLREIMCRTSPYFLIALFTGTTLAGSASYGLGALVVFAGPRDALRAVWDGSSPGLPWYRRLHWGPVIHLPFIGPVLVLNRILRLFSLYVTVPNLMVVCATAISTVLTSAILNANAQLYPHQYAILARLTPADELTRWPPSPWWVMAAGPTITHLYSIIYRELFGNIERRLDRELKRLEGRGRHRGEAPLQQEGGVLGAHVGNNEREPEIQAPGPAQAAAPGRGNLGGGLRLAIDFLFWDDGWQAVQEDAEDEEQQGRRGAWRRRVRNAQGLQIEVAGPNGAQDGQQQQQQQDQQPQEQQRQQQPDDADADPNANRPQGRENDGHIHGGPDLYDLLNSIATTLLFPGIAFAAGEMLKLVLPKSWSQHHRPSSTGWSRPASGGWGGRPTGLLQQQWGRSLAGGCLYVVLRDLCRLYVKHRKVKIWPLMKVREGERGRRMRDGTGGQDGA